MSILTIPLQTSRCGRLGLLAASVPLLSAAAPTLRRTQQLPLQDPIQSVPKAPRLALKSTLRATCAGQKVLRKGRIVFLTKSGTSLATQRHTGPRQHAWLCARDRLCRNDPARAADQVTSTSRHCSSSSGICQRTRSTSPLLWPTIRPMRDPVRSYTETCVSSRFRRHSHLYHFYRSLLLRQARPGVQGV